MLRWKVERCVWPGGEYAEHRHNPASKVTCPSLSAFLSSTACSFFFFAVSNNTKSSWESCCAAWHMKHVQPLDKFSRNALYLQQTLLVLLRDLALPPVLFQFLQLTTRAKRAGTLIRPSFLRSRRFCSSCCNSSSNNTCQKHLASFPQPLEGESQRHTYTQPALFNIALVRFGLPSAPGFRVTEPDRFWPRSTGPPQFAALSIQRSYWDVLARGAPEHPRLNIGCRITWKQCGSLTQTW